MSLSALLSYAWPYRWKLAIVTVLSLLGALASLAIPWLAAQLLGGVLDASEARLELVVPLLIAALLLLTLLSVANSLVSASVSARILADLRESVYGHIQCLPLAFHDQNRQGELITLMSWDVAMLSGFISGSVAASFSAVITAAGSMIILFWIDPGLALVLPITIPAFYIAMKFSGRRLRAISGHVRSAEGQVMSRLEQNLQMLPAIKSFAREEIEQRDYDADVETARRLRIEEARIYAILGPAMQLLVGLGVVAVILLASRGIASREMDASQLFGFLLYAALLTRPIGTLADLYGQFNGARGSLERLAKVLEEEREPGYRATGTVEASHGEIVFDGVWFAYPGREDILRAASITVRSGEIVAITGENGAGKTTLVRLLMGLYRPRQGTIFLGGQDISEIQLQDLRRQIGYVPQRALLFNGSVHANIAYGLESEDEVAVERAARLAQAWDFIAKLPQGLDTVIGDHGVRLSGGQRQRIALARALIKDPPVLILDEATSMYDLEGEAAFVDACSSALSGRTVLLITHRPASLALADRELKIADGKIVEIDETGAS